MGILIQELGLLYEAFSAAAPSPLPALPIQYADFAHWQRHWQQHAAIEAQLAYWRQQLRAPLHILTAAYRSFAEKRGKLTHSAPDF